MKKNLLFLIVIFLPALAAAEDIKTIHIGVLAFRSPEKTMERWQPTIDYLSHAVPGHHFAMLPMNYPEINSAAQNRSIDFILTNTGHYVELEAKHGIVRMVTLVKSIDGNSIKVFGGVIFTRADRSELNTIADLKGTDFTAVKKSSLGGFLVAWEEFQENKIDPFSDFSNMSFNGMPHDEVVFKVLNKETDAGTVRTSVLEQMVKEGQIRLEDLKIINRKYTKGFPYIHSTALYPEWPFARMPHADDDLVEKVTVALLNIQKENPAAIAGGYDRWTPPLDYRSVHDMFKKLNTGPYQSNNVFTFQDVLKKYIFEISIIFLVFSILMIALGKIIQLNRSLKKALSEVKTLRGFIPICSSCKKIRDDNGYWNQIEIYISEHSDARLSHGICPDCSEKLYGKEAWYIDMEKTEKK